MSKIKLCKQAENLYIEEGLSVDDICQNLNVARRTIFYWKKKYEWDKIRDKKYKSETKFSAELMDMAIKFMKQVSKNIDNKTQTSQAEYYTLLNLIKNIPEIKKYEKELAKNSTTSKSTTKSFSPKFIRQVQKDILVGNRKSFEINTINNSSNFLPIITSSDHTKYICIKKNGKWGIVDYQKKKILPIMFDEI